MGGGGEGQKGRKEKVVRRGKDKGTKSEERRGARKTRRRDRRGEGKCFFHSYFILL